jgi:hypothetical protein
MNLLPERQKKADELGLPFLYDNNRNVVTNKDNHSICRAYAGHHDTVYQMVQSANRVLQLEQAVEELRGALKTADAEIFRLIFRLTGWVTTHEHLIAKRTVKEALKQTENL